MRRLIIILFLMLFGVVGQASAEKSDQYWMAKAGVTFFDHAGSPDYLQAVNFTYGYGLTAAIAAEVDYQQSIGGGKYTITPTGETGELSYLLASVGVAYRHVFYERLYFRGKLAFAIGDEERTSSLEATRVRDVANVAGGLALGVLAGNVIGSSLTLELEYMKQSESLSSVMLGVNLTF